MLRDGLVPRSYMLLGTNSRKTNHAFLATDASDISWGAQLDGMIMSRTIVWCLDTEIKEIAQKPERIAFSKSCI